MEYKMDEKQKNEIADIAKKVLNDYLSNASFAAKKITDTPKDSLQVVNRRYVTMNGTSANRPTASVVGQSYFDTSIKTNGAPVWWQGTGFVDANGNFI
jgi:hypothetical protein